MQCLFRVERPPGFTFTLGVIATMGPIGSDAIQAW